MLVTRSSVVFALILCEQAVIVFRVLTNAFSLLSVHPASEIYQQRTPIQMTVLWEEWILAFVMRWLLFALYKLSVTYLWPCISTFNIRRHDSVDVNAAGRKCLWFLFYESLVQTYDVCSHHTCIRSGGSLWWLFVSFKKLRVGIGADMILKWLGLCCKGIYKSWESLNWSRNVLFLCRFITYYWTLSRASWIHCTLLHSCLHFLRN